MQNLVSSANSIKVEQVKHVVAQNELKIFTLSDVGFGSVALKKRCRDENKLGAIEQQTGRLAPSPLRLECVRRPLACVPGGLCCAASIDARLEYRTACAVSLRLTLALVVFTPCRFDWSVYGVHWRVYRAACVVPLRLTLDWNTGRLAPCRFD